MAPDRVLRIQLRAYLELILEHPDNIVCIGSIDGLPRRRGENTFQILLDIIDVQGAAALSFQNETKKRIILKTC